MEGQNRLLPRFENRFVSFLVGLSHDFTLIEIFQKLLQESFSLIIGLTLSLNIDDSQKINALKELCHSTCIMTKYDQ